MSEEAIKVVEQIKSETDFFQKAKLLKILNKEKSVPIKDISKALDMKPAYVCHILRLNKLPEIVLDGYYSNLVSITHLFIIARLKSQEDMIKAYETVLSQGLTSQKTEEIVRQMLYNLDSTGERLDPDELSTYHKKLQELPFKTSVRIIQTRIKGKIVIEIPGNLGETKKTLRYLLKKLTEGDK